MKPTEPLALHHSWPLFDWDRRLEPTLIAGVPALTGPHSAEIHDLVQPGRWECDLENDSLIWSSEVHDIFGLPHDARPTRHETLAFYADHSRAAMERLRAYAIKHRRGFTLDAEIHPATGKTRWMRLIAAPICEDDRVVRLHGLKKAL